MITEQLTNITMRQDAMEKKVGIGRPEPVGFQMPSAGRAAVPVSSLLSSAGPKPSVSNLGALVGPPQAPCMKPPAVEPDKEEEADKEALSSPVTRVPLEQSRALSRLVAYFHAVGSDPMSDLSSTTPSMGVKGTAAREKLQRELAQGSGQFFLQRRMSPTSRPATSPSEIGGISLLAYLERYGGPRAKQRAWHDTMVARSRLRCYGQGRMGPCQRPFGLDHCDDGASIPGQQQVEFGLASSPPRRCSSESLDFEGPNSYGLQASICSSLCSDMDDHSRGVSHRGGPADVKEERSTVRGQRRNQLRQPCAKTKPKAKAGERKGKPSAAVWPSGGDRMSPFHAGGAVDGMASGCFGGGSEAMSSLGTDCGDAGSFVSTGKRNAQFLGGQAAMPGHLEDEFIKKELDTVPSGSKISTFSFSFFTWCMAITRWTSATRTGFSRYRGSTLCLRRDGPPAPSTALLPLPLPAFWPYAGSPNNPKRRKDKEGVLLVLFMW